jgi:DNA-directed RNA polymerase specialized sigma24 family protein
VLAARPGPDVDARLDVETALSALTPNRRRVARATLLAGRSSDRVAVGLHRSGQAVRQLRAAALEDLRKHFTG